MAFKAVFAQQRFDFRRKEIVRMQGGGEANESGEEGMTKHESVFGRQDQGRPVILSSPQLKDQHLKYASEANCRTFAEYQALRISIPVRRTLQRDLPIGND